MSRRPVSRHGLARGLILLALLLLGGLAAPRLPLVYEPRSLFPELGVELTLPAGSLLAGSRERFLGELETVIARSGEVAATSGAVGETSLRLRVRYRPGVSIAKKTSLLEALLQDLRRQLPAGARLAVAAAQERRGGSSFVVEVARADGLLLEAVRRLPGVASASFTGSRSPELRVDFDAALPPHRQPSVSEIAAGLRPRRLGRAGELEVERAALPLEALQLGRGRLGQFGHLTTAAGESFLDARVDGQPALLLVVGREPDASPRELGRDLRRLLTDAGLGGGRFWRDEARPLELLQGRLVGGLVAASLLLAGLHLLLVSARAAAWQLVALPLGLAAALPPLYLAGASLDVLTLPALLLALLLAPLPATLSRAGAGAAAWAELLFAGLAAAALPVALELLGRLGIFLGGAAKVFLIALVAAAAAQFLLPASGAPRPRMAAAARSLQAWARRRGGSLLLATAVAGYLAWIGFGAALWPRTGALNQDLGDLAVQLQLPRQSSWATTAAEVAQVERRLGLRPEIASKLVIFGRGQATFYLELAEAAQPRYQLELLAGELEQELRGLGLVVEARPLGNADNAPPLRFDEDEELRPATDPATRTYRVLLRGRDFATVVAATEQLRSRLRGLTDSWGIELVPDWQAPEAALVLQPLPGTTQSQIASARAALTGPIADPNAIPLPALPGQTLPLLLRRVGNGQSSDGDEPPLAVALAALRSRDGDLRRYFELTETFTPPELHWQSGLFVVPLDFEFRSRAASWTLARSELHAVLQRLPLPVDTDLALPALGGEGIEKRLRLLLSLALLPLLLLALLAMRLDSLFLALAALLPAAGAVAACAPLLYFHAGGLDEASLLALAATLAGLLPLAAFTAGACREPRLVAVQETGAGWATRGHRRLSRSLPLVAPGLLAAALTLLFLGADLSSERQVWVKPQRVAGLALLAAAALALFVSPALQVAAEGALRSLRPEARARRRELADPAAWREPGDNLLEVRSLSKKYGNGFRALRRVDLRLGQGITALLGPNGAGKTTLLRTLCGTLSPTRGQVYFRGLPVLPENLRAYRRRVGYLPQSFNAWDGLSAARFLDYWADLLELPTGTARQQEIAAALTSVGLEAMAAHAVRELSGGQRRRLGIARALLGRPPILIVDEPTTGLDVEARQQLRQSLAALAHDRIVIFSTHIASDIASVASRVLILDGGRLRFDGAPAELIATASGRVFEKILAEDELRPFSRRYHITTRIRESGGIRVRAVTHPGQECEGEPAVPNLEEAYLAHLGGAVKLRDERSWASLLDLEAWRSH